MSLKGLVVVLAIAAIVAILCKSHMESYLPYDNGFERPLNGPYTRRASGDIQYMPIESSKLQDNVYSTISSLPYGTTPIADQGSTLKQRGFIEIPYDLNKI